MSETIYAKGIRIFPKNENAPDFVKGTMIISLNELVKFCKENPKLLTEYKGVKQLKCQLLDGKMGLYATVDTFKPDKKKEPEQSGLPESESKEDDSLPF